jgi:hypothetical protein
MAGKTDHDNDKTPNYNAANDEPFPGRLAVLTEIDFKFKKVLQKHPPLQMCKSVIEILSLNPTLQVACAIQHTAANAISGVAPSQPKTRGSLTTFYGVLPTTPLLAS